MIPAAPMTRGGKAAYRRAVLALLLLAAAGMARAENHPVVFQSTETPPFWSASLPENGLGGTILHLISDAAGVAYSIEYLPVKRFRHSLATYIVGDPDILINQKHRAIFPIGLFRSAFFYYKPHHEVIEFHSLRDLRDTLWGCCGERSKTRTLSLATHQARRERFGRVAVEELKREGSIYVFWWMQPDNTRSNKSFRRNRVISFR